MARKIGASSSVNNLLNNTDLAYSIEIMMVLLSQKFKVPQIELYDRSKNLVEYLNTFKAHMSLHNFSEEIACQAFPLTLKGVVR